MEPEKPRIDALEENISHSTGPHHPVEVHEIDRDLRNQFVQLASLANNMVLHIGSLCEEFHPSELEILIDDWKNAKEASTTIEEQREKLIGRRFVASSIATVINNHDVRTAENVLGVAEMYSQRDEAGEIKPPVYSIEDGRYDEHMEMAFHATNHLKYLADAQARILFGNNDFMRLSSQQVEASLKGYLGSGAERVHFSGTEDITSLQYVALFQMVKNAHKATAGDIKINLYSLGTYIIAEVIDEGIVHDPTSRVKRYPWMPSDAEMTTKIDGEFSLSPGSSAGNGFKLAYAITMASGGDLLIERETTDGRKVYSARLGESIDRPHIFQKKGTTARLIFDDHKIRYDRVKRPA